MVDRDLTEYQITQTLTLPRLQALIVADKGNPTVKSPFEVNRKTLRFNVARIHGSGELACTTRRSDELYLQNDVGNDWQNWRKVAYTANASVAV